MYKRQGTWTAAVPQKLYGKYYTFQIKHKGKWLDETPGVWAKAVGVNGQRAAIIDLNATDPADWANDKGPKVDNFTDVVLYEAHMRDLSMDHSSGIANKGKFLQFTEPGTKSPQGEATGIDHLKELGVTHVHILPSYDYNSVDETNLQDNTYNWGYDPQNYNAPEGSYSTNPSDPATRVREMKEMIQALHNAGIGVVMDVVYNHTAQNDESNFELTAPGYYHRHWNDGKYSDASGCGNETASDLKQMQDYIVNSVKYWAKEYHVDGFRFDLMAIHDTETMNRVAAELKKINPSIFVYGEGWTGGSCPLPEELRAMKKNARELPDFAMFSDDLRDGVKGSVFYDADCGYVNGKAAERAELIKSVMSGGIWREDVGRASAECWTDKPQQSVNYVEAHDNLTLYDLSLIHISEPTRP